MSIAWVRFGPDASWYLQYTDGVYESEGLPPALDAALQCSDVPCSTLELGPEGQWFVRFEDGYCRWDGLSQKLEELVKVRSLPCCCHDHICCQEWTPLLVAFAQTGDGWFVRFEDDTTMWDGLPDPVHDIMEQRTVSWVSLWADEGWFVQFPDGSHSASALPSALPSTLQQVACVSIARDCASFFVRAGSLVYWGCNPAMNPLESLLNRWLPQWLSPDSVWFTAAEIPDNINGTSLPDAIVQLKNCEGGIAPLQVAWHVSGVWYTLQNSRCADSTYCYVLSG